MMIRDIGTPTHGVTLVSGADDISLIVFGDGPQVYLTRADALRLRDALTEMLVADGPADTMVEAVPAA